MGCLEKSTTVWLAIRLNDCSRERPATITAPPRSCVTRLQSHARAACATSSPTRCGVQSPQPRTQPAVIIPSFSPAASSSSTCCTRIGSRRRPPRVSSCLWHNLRRFLRFAFYDYCYHFYDPGTQFPGNKKITLCNTKKYKKSSWNESYSSSPFTKQSCSKMALYRWIKTESRWNEKLIYLSSPDWSASLRPSLLLLFFLHPR